MPFILVAVQPQFRDSQRHARACSSAAFTAPTNVAFLETPTPRVAAGFIARSLRGGLRRGR
eukprot:5061516-Pyramimonas_sp.AAC.1